MAILKINNLKKDFGTQKVLQGINLEINEAGIYALIGPNGSGKTTLFNIISNLLKPTSGTVEVVGKKNSDASIFYEVSFLKDNRVLYEYLTGYDHLNFIAGVQKLSKKSIDEVIDKLHIRYYMHKKVGNCSLGMKQQLLIAMAMLNNPKLMILDEPLNGLDPTAVIKVRNILKQSAEKGMVVLISSHSLSEIDLLTNNVFFLKEGQLIFENINFSKNNTYNIQISDDSLSRVALLEDEMIKASFKDNILTVNIFEKDINYLLNKLNEYNIKYTDIIKVKYGVQDQYIKMFPEEMNKIS